MNLNLIPTPKKVRITEKTVKIKNTDLYLSDSLTRYVKKANELLCGTGTIEVNYTLSNLLDTEEYRLNVTQDSVQITASAPNGVYYALVTLSQLLQLNNGEICLLEIEDKPTMPLRGISDDISRGQVSTLQNFKDIIRRMSLIKCNVYMPYMEDTFAFRKFPESGKFSDPVTQEEWAELVEYAK